MPTNPIMITRARTQAHTPAWQQAWSRALRDPHQLLLRLDLDPSLAAGAASAHGLFRLRVPESYLARIRPGDPDDPLLLQVLPQAAEALERPGFGPDPVDDAAAMAAPGLLHKYPGRALLIATGACAIHCRYCFRREFPYGEFGGLRDWGPALAYIREHRDISEVILSGGDPLALPDHRLTELLLLLERIPHLRRLRIHTRLPVVLPERIDAGLLSWLGRGRLQHILVLHANHPREFDPPADTALAQLRASGVTLLNQSVLLAGVNDDLGTLCELQERGFAAGILPYYLHLLDRVRGAAHFEVPEARARELHAGLGSRLPGYLVPRLVREVPGASGKVPLPP
ncbi:EF-P beta-lysylation protein EpmB [Thioalkalivibrio sp.]|uniref:EF-P beta-lysylation protein EpmB n=1 Tax=Thioalkalivibrio sp. TaxID=2093813 RepID=UPI003976AEB4